MAIDYNRQYIGARYVPQFFKNPNGSWDWAQGFQYEPLTIVRYGENSYTSTQLVPATVPSPNLAPDYWAQTGNYNGIIQNLQEQINDLKKPINYNPYQRSFGIIGDSYGTGISAEGSTNPYTTQFKNFITSQGGKVEVHAYNSSGFIGNTNVTFLDLLNSFTSTDIDYLIVQGMANDVGKNTTQLLNAINTFLDAAKQKFPNAIIKILFISKDYTVNNYNLFNWLLTNNVPFEPSSKLIMCSRSYFSSDHVHPTQEGQNIIFKSLLDIIITGRCYANYNGGITNISEILVNDSYTINITATFLQSLFSETPGTLFDVNLKCASGFTDFGLEIPYKASSGWGKIKFINLKGKIVCSIDTASPDPNTFTQNNVYNFNAYSQCI